MIIVLYWVFFVSSFTNETLDYQDCKKAEFKLDKCKTLIFIEHTKEE